MSVSFTAERRLWAVPLVVVAMAALAMLGLWVSERAKAGAGVPGTAPLPANGKIVYLPDATSPAIAASTLSAFGVQTVASPQALDAAASGADAVMIDQGRLGQLSSGWLAQQFARNKVIVGLNTPSDQLEQLTGYQQEQPKAPFRQNWGGQAFFSAVYQSPPSKQRQASGRTSDQITTPAALVSRIQRMIPDAHGEAPEPVR